MCSTSIRSVHVSILNTHACKCVCRMSLCASSVGCWSILLCGVHHCGDGVFKENRPQSTEQLPTYGLSVCCKSHTCTQIFECFNSRSFHSLKLSIESSIVNLSCWNLPVVVIVCARHCIIHGRSLHNVTDRFLKSFCEAPASSQLIQK